MSNIAKMIAIAKRFGGSSSPSEVVILSETELTPAAEGMFGIMPPLSATPTDGATAKIVYNGVEYTSPIILGEDDGLVMYGMGNTDMMGLPGGNADAPFVVVLIPSGMDGAYGMVRPMDGATTVTLSIVQVGAASGGESAGGGVVVATAIIADDQTVTSIDKTYAELLTAFDAGKPVQMIVKSSMADFMMPLIIHLKLGGDYLLFGAYTDTKNLTLNASLRYNADGTAVYAST